MGIKDIFNASKIKAENDNLKSLMTPELQEASALLSKIAELKETITNLEEQISKKSTIAQKIDADIEQKKLNLITFEDDILVQDFGLYQPRFNYATSDEYKKRILKIRERQKLCVKENRAVTGNMNFTYNGSKSQGNKMVRDMQKLLLRAFNSECNEITNNVKYNNFDMSLKKMVNSAEAVARLGSMLSISISQQYLELKKNELQAVLENQLKKQDEKEALKQAKADLREQAKLQKEIEEQRRKIEKEQTHYLQALLLVIKQLEKENDNADLLQKKAEMEGRLSSIDEALKTIDYREANQRAGYVYIISNIGSFGPNVYKIGMTRRLDPQERVDELGDASVPFRFDVHAMIFSDDAPKLEAALHREFENRKLNMVNQRREFFQVTLDEIKEVLKKNFDKTVEFLDFPDAEQYRISQKLRAELGVSYEESNSSFQSK